MLKSDADGLALLIRLAMATDAEVEVEVPCGVLKKPEAPACALRLV